jgi:hypothetical protein
MGCVVIRACDCDGSGVISMSSGVSGTCAMSVGLYSMVGVLLVLLPMIMCVSCRAVYLVAIVKPGALRAQCCSYIYYLVCYTYYGYIEVYVSIMYNIAYYVRVYVISYGIDV